MESQLTNCVWNVNPEDRLCSLCSLTGCADRTNTIRRHGAVFSQVKSMNVKDTKVFDIQYWNAVRSAAGKAKEYWGTVFKVKKDKNKIYITRLE